MLNFVYWRLAFFSSVCDVQFCRAGFSTAYQHCFVVIVLFDNRSCAAVVYETSMQWRSQPRNFGGAKCLILGE